MVENILNLLLKIKTFAIKKKSFTSQNKMLMTFTNLFSKITTFTIEEIFSTSQEKLFSSYKRSKYNLKK